MFVKFVIYLGVVAVEFYGVVSCLGRPFIALTILYVCFVCSDPTVCLDVPSGCLFCVVSEKLFQSSFLSVLDCVYFWCM